MDEVIEAIEKYQGLVPLVYDIETMCLDEARPQDMPYAVYLKREADKVIAELEAKNQDLCERVTENDEIRLHWEEIEQTRAENERMKSRIAELEEERRWRKFPDEKPKEKQWILVYYGYENNGCRIDLRRWDTSCKFDVENQELYTHWMPLPSAPKEYK